VVLTERGAEVAVGELGGAVNQKWPTSKSKNQNKRVVCDFCGKEMHSDAFRGHRGGRKCHK
jgi:hypothetical protein